MRRALRVAMAAAAERQNRWTDLARVSPRLTLLVLRCRDVERSRDFFAALGATMVPERHGNGRLHYSSQLGDVVLELYPLASTESASVGVRLAFQVTDLSNMVDALSRAGGRLVRWRESGRAAIVVDPDGNTIELHGDG